MVGKKKAVSVSQRKYFEGRIKDLARILELDKEVVKGVIGSLVKKGLVSTYFHDFDPFNKSRGFWLIDMGEKAFDILEELGH